MLYILSVGKIEQNLKGMPLPDCVVNKPILNMGLGLYLDAFFDLDSERFVGMGLGRIPWSSIRMYAEFYTFDEEQTQNLFFFINQMDAAYLKKVGA